MNTEIIEKYNMLPKGTKLLCAVSGGADSMCLLKLMLSKADELGITVCAAHFEHGIRGEESLRDADFVAKWCRENNVELVLEHGNAEAYAKERSLSLEEAARELRYDFLERAAKKTGSAKIATAHNADDNVETMLFNLARGTGSLGLCGIPPVRGNIVRPLLLCTRAEIEQFLEDNNVPHVEDSSNFSDDYSRNMIRHKVMPVLREINPGVSAAAGRTAELLREDESYLSEAADNFIKKHFDGESVDAAGLLKLPRPISARVIRKLSKQKLSYRHVEDILKLCSGEGLGWADIPGMRIRREKGRIFFNNESWEKIQDRELIPGTEIEIPELQIRIKTDFAVKKEEINDLFKTYIFKYEDICGNIMLTGRKNGDSIRPKGRNCTKSLKKLFLEAGYNQRQRDLTPILRDDKGILAVHGLAVSQRAEAVKGDKILRIRIERI